MDQATTERWRRHMIAPRTGGRCRFCNHPVLKSHCGTFCGDCQAAGLVCSSVEAEAASRASRAEMRVTR